MYVIRYARTAHGPRTQTRFAYEHSTHTDPRQRHSAPMLQTLVRCYTPPFHSTSALGEGIMGMGSARENAELSIPDFAGEPYFLGNFQKCFFSMRALFPFIFPEILRKGNLRTRSTAESFSRGWLRVRLRVKRYAVDERFALRSFLLRCYFFFSVLGVAYATILLGG